MKTTVVNVAAVIDYDMTRALSLTQLTNLLDLESVEPHHLVLTWNNLPDDESAALVIARGSHADAIKRAYLLGQLRGVDIRESRQGIALDLGHGAAVPESIRFALRVLAAQEVAHV